MKGIEFSVSRPGWKGLGAAEKGRSKKLEGKSGKTSTCPACLSQQHGSESVPSDSPKAAQKSIHPLGRFNGKLHEHNTGKGEYGAENGSDQDHSKMCETGIIQKEIKEAVQEQKA